SRASTSWIHGCYLECAITRLCLQESSNGTSGSILQVTGVEPEIDNRGGQKSTAEERYLRAQLDTANDMWGHFKRLAEERADAKAAHEKRIAQLKRDMAAEKAEVSAACE